ncbi:MAG: xanthine dehydrogenase family protein subunit M [Haloferacaceae archaeon]
MYPSSFDYRRPQTVAEALELQADADGEVELLAGGHSLIPTMKSGLAEPDLLIDISDIDELRGVEVGDETTTFGALTTYATIANHEGAQETCPTLTAAASQVGDIQVRNRGTIGGNVAHADPASDLPGAVLAENATVHVQGPDGAREIPIDEFFFGMYATDVGPDEILTAVEVPNADDNTVGTYVKKPNPASGYALVGVAVSLQVAGGTVESARVAANGAIDHGTRLASVEDALAGEQIDDDLAESASAGAGDDIEEYLFMEDLHASAEFRQQLLKVYTERALDAAFERAGERVEA